jgi:hypothetical protein
MMSVHDDYSWDDTWEQWGDDSQKEHYGSYGQYMRTLQDVRRGYELMQDYRTSEPGAIQTTRSDENMFEGSKWLRQTINDFGYMGYRGQEKGQGDRPTGATAAEMQQNSLDGNFVFSDESKYMLKQSYLETKKLYEAQKRAGGAMGFDKIYGTMPDSWRMYTDGTFEIGDVSTDEGLKAALRNIEASGDSSNASTPDYRNAAQRDYLAQKAWVRYLDSKLDQMGIADGWATIPNFLDNEFNDINGTELTLGKVGAGFDPAYSYADDYEKYGWHTKPTRDRFSMEHLAEYGGTIPESWGDPYWWVDHQTMDSDYEVPAGLLSRWKEKPDWLKDAEENLFKDGVLPPDMVAGRYDTVDEYLQALHSISEEEHDAWVPPDETDPWYVPPQAWDPEGLVPDGIYPYDEAQGLYVKPGEQTPGAVYNPVTNKYEVPAEPDVVEVSDPDETTPVVHEDADFFGALEEAHFATSAGVEGPQPGIDYPLGWHYDPETGLVEDPTNQYWYLDEAVLMFEQADHLAAEAAAAAAAKDEADAAAEDDKKTDAETDTQVVPDEHHTAGQHVHDDPELIEHDPPEYMLHAHEDLHFQHTRAPAHIPTAVKTI